MNPLAFLLAALTFAFGAQAAGGRSATLSVSNMDCATRPITVRLALEKVPGVQAAKVDFKTKLAVVGYDPTKTTPEALIKATADPGFPSTLKQVP